MLESGDVVAAGISGGADSVCLLFVLLKIRQSIPFTLLAVHVNHKIRREAGEDAAFVKGLCEKWGCPYRYVEEDVEAYARERRLSTEEAGRIVRYKAFERALADAGAPEGKIAVAHTKNDSAETALFHLLRGSGLTGMGGIRCVRGRVIRPLLCAERKEIEAFLLKNQIGYCIDRTNNEDTYTRNRIRRHILAYAEREICSGAVSHIYDASVILQETEGFVRRSAEGALLRCSSAMGGEIVFDTALFLREDPYLQKQMLLLTLEGLTESRKDIGAAHIRALLGLFTRSGNGRADLPGGLTAYREYGNVRISAQKEKKEKPAPRPLQIPGITEWEDGMRFLCRTFPYEKNQIIPQKTYTKWFDYDKIIKSLVLRTRREGDYLAVYQDGRKKSLKSYLTGEKTPAAKRDGLALIADGSHIVWVVGYRISERYKIDGQTKTVLQIQAIGGATDGRNDQGIAD